MKKIVLVEDDYDFATILKQFLEVHNFDVTWVENGQSALDLLENNNFDIGILDIMMPIVDGFTLAEKLVSIHPEMPFVFLTARNQNMDRINGLKLGADDYIVKPFEPYELVLRLQNILKRVEKKIVTHSLTTTIQIGDFNYDPMRMELNYKNSKQQLTEKEAILLVYLYNHKNQLLKREQILESVWNSSDFFAGRSMDVYISKLRKHLAKDPSIQIESLRNIGLEFKIPEKQI